MIPLRGYEHFPMPRTMNPAMCAEALPSIIYTALCQSVGEHTAEATVTQMVLTFDNKLEGESHYDIAVEPVPDNYRLILFVVYYKGHREVLDIMEFPRDYAATEWAKKRIAEMADNNGIRDVLSFGHRVKDPVDFAIYTANSLRRD